ncbi:MAG TPA: DUF6531 domain-containing protein, partial [Acidimicrobiales bacterium]|nr:DUF6531 domain-containing protein [Acidimicrobiales bacterium]
DIFDFDGDGVCSPNNSTNRFSPGPPGANSGVGPCLGNTEDTSYGGYGGPDSYFTNISSNYETGMVHFISPIPPGGSTFFSLESALASASVSAAGPQTAPVQVSPVGGISLSSLIGGSDPVGCNPCASGGTVGVNGVVPATGSLVESSQDIAVPGAGVPLALSRTYDSGLAQLEVSGSTAPGPLGYGWSYNLGMSLSYSSSSHLATIDQANGSEIVFSPFVAGSSPSWCTGTTNFCPNQPRNVATLNQNSNGTWTFVSYAGGNEMAYGFSSSGALVSVTDQVGNSLTATSEAAGSGACPSSATSCTVWASSASGRSLTLAFDSSGRLASATDGSGNTVSYCYFGQSCANGATEGGAHDLYSAVLPGGATTTYGYDSSNSTAAFDHDILTEGLPTGGTVTNTFNSAGQVASQDAPSADITVTYSGNNQNVSGGSTVISTWPAGTSGSLPAQVVDYQFSSLTLVAETTGYGTSSASTTYFDPDPTSLVPTLVQDGNTGQSLNTLAGTANPLNVGDVTFATDGVGNVTEYAYNADNQVWCEVAPADYLYLIGQADEPPYASVCPASAPSSPPQPGASDLWSGETINFYNSAGELTAVTDPLGNTTTYSYTSAVPGVPNGLQYCSVDPVDYQKTTPPVSCPAYGATHVNGTTTETYDSAGDMLTSTDADGNTTTYTYTVSGHPGLVSSVTSPDGTVTGYTYNTAGQVTSQTESFGAYSATTDYAYDAAGDQYCSVAPEEVALGVNCPPSPPSSPPAPGNNDPYPDATITTFDGAGRPVQVTNPLGGVTYTAYDQAGNVYCTCAPVVAASDICPSSPPSSPPTVGSDQYLGATITTYDTLGRPVQVTNPLGGITLDQYDADNNLTQTTVESNNSTADPNIVTSYTYDADNRVIFTTVDPGGGPLAATTAQSYDPDGNVYCSVSANAYASGNYQCPAWQAAWIAGPPNPTSLYSTTPSASEANNVTTSFYDANGNLLQSTNPDVETTVSAYDGDGRSYCSADATNVASWLGANPSGSYPYLCPKTPLTTPPAQGSNPGYSTTIYDPAGRVTSSTDPVGDTTSYTYSPGGEVLTTTNPVGSVTTDCYYYQDAAGQCAAGAPSGGGAADELYSVTTPVTAADPGGATTYYSYYPGGQAETTTTPAGTTTDSYDANGDLSSVVYSATAAGYATPSNISGTYNTD